MKKRILAVMLTGAVTVGGCFGVFAEDSAPVAVTAEGEADGVSEALGGLLGALGVSDEDSSTIEESLGGLLGSLGLSEGEGEGGLSDLLGGLLGGEGGLDLGSLLGGADISELSKSILGEEISQEDISGLLSIFNDPEKLKSTLTGLLAEGSPVAVFLDKLAGQNNVIGSIVSSLKGNDGTYDVQRVIDTIESVEEGEGDTLVINGETVTEDEITTVIEEAAEAFGLTEDAA